MHTCNQTQTQRTTHDSVTIVLMVTKMAVNFMNCSGTRSAAR